MPCKKCLDKKNNNNNIKETQCFFHETKNIILNNSEDNIKKWIDNLNNLYNSNPSFYKLVTLTYPKLLKQNGIYKKKSNIFITNITDYILEKTNNRYIGINSNTISTYIDNVKLNIKNLNISLLKEQHFNSCIIKQELSLNDSINLCFPKKQRNGIYDIINFYRERDRILWKELYHIPSPIISIIINLIG
jgi:hypothetical protein